MFNKLKKSRKSGDESQAAVQLNPSSSIVTAPPPSVHDDRNDAPSVSTSVGASTKPAMSVAPPLAAAPPPVVAPAYQDQPETDYDLGPTQLYTLIENKNWDSAIERARTTPMEVETWISRREPDDPNKIRWRLLPLHATCVFRAPLSLLEALLVVYPPSATMMDDQGMLPIHLACRNGASRGVVMTLLNAYPKSIYVKDKKGRSPLNLVENSNSQNKDTVIDAMQAFRVSLENDNLPLAGSGPRAVSPAVSPAMTGGGVKRNVLGSTGAVKNTVGEREVDYENRTILFRLILKKDWESVTNRLILFPDEASTWIVTRGFNGNLRFLPLHKVS